MTLLKQLSDNMARGRYYEEQSSNIWSSDTVPVRLIAFYLPQFYPFPENDLWWGRGFTEWTNVTKALPRFVNHYQPHLPGELGFYDLRMTEPLRQQADLARKYGLSGFCFHHYWFAGKRLLETPLNNLLAHPDIDLPFCINWANENWSRRWDGFDNQVLLAQRHSPEDDLAFAASLERYVRDPRYIHIGGRPLIMLYRPGILPDAAATVGRWRNHFERVGLPNPYVTMAQAFGDNDPRKYGIDAAVGFPPHNGGWDCQPVNGTLQKLDDSFAGQVVSYEDVASRALLNQSKDYRLFPGVCPGWDNEARKPGRGFTCVGSTPEKYGRWLLDACRDTLEAEKPEEQIVFINAWNEWAEGAHLEPDRHFGYAYLAETARVLTRLNNSSEEDLNAREVNMQVVKNVTSISPLSRFLKKARYRAADTAESVAKALRP